MWRGQLPDASIQEQHVVEKFSPHERRRQNLERNLAFKVRVRRPIEMNRDLSTLAFDRAAARC